MFNVYDNTTQRHMTQRHTTNVGDTRVWTTYPQLPTKSRTSTLLPSRI